MLRSFRSAASATCGVRNLRIATCRSSRLMFTSGLRVVAWTRPVALGTGLAQDRVPDLTLGAHLAFQAEPRPSPPPHPGAEAQGHELARLRRQLASTRQLGGVVHQRGDRGLAGCAAYDCRRAGLPLRHHAAAAATRGLRFGGRANARGHLPSEQPGHVGVAPGRGLALAFQAGLERGVGPIQIQRDAVHSFGPDTLIHEIGQTSDIQQQATPWNMENGSPVPSAEQDYWTCSSSPSRNRSS